MRFTLGNSSVGVWYLSNYKRVYMGVVDSQLSVRICSLELFRYVIISQYFVVLMVTFGRNKKNK